MPRPVNDNIVATAGGTQAAGAPLREGINRVITVATAADSVTLPSTQDVTGEDLVVINAAAANSMNVFPAVGEQINAVAANGAFAMAAGKTCHFYCSGAGHWYANLSA